MGGRDGDGEWMVGAMSLDMGGEQGSAQKDQWAYLLPGRTRQRQSRCLRTRWASESWPVLWWRGRREQLRAWRGARASGESGGECPSLSPAGQVISTEGIAVGNAGLPELPHGNNQLIQIYYLFAFLIHEITSFRCSACR